MNASSQWRDWNQYQGNINQQIMEATMDALVDRSRLVNGVPTSLADLGYTDAGKRKRRSAGPQRRLETARRLSP